MPEHAAASHLRAALLALLASCGSPPPGSPPPEPALAAVVGQVDRPGQAWLFARHPEAVVELVLPPANRGDIPTTLPLVGFRLVRSGAWADEYSTLPPYRLRLAGSPPTGVVVRNDVPKNLAHAGWDPDAVGRPHTWAAHDGQVVVRVPPGEPPPENLRMAYDDALERERSLNQGVSRLSPRDFVFRSELVRDARRQGLYLPAPASAEFEVDVPAGAVLDVEVAQRPSLVLDGTTTDGAVALVEIRDAASGEWALLGRAELAPLGTERLRVSLAGREGRARLRFRSDPKGTNDLDYVFFSEPALYVPSEEPRRVVLLFVDTLRPDHMGTWGYDRPTSPVLDAWAAQGAVFAQARSIAPWTLPSARAALSGQAPQSWGQSEHMGQILGAAGYASVALIGNTYLGPAFGMSAGWSEHRLDIEATADEVVDEALRTLDRYGDRDLLLLAHFMDVHLPYAGMDQPSGAFTHTSRPLLPGDAVREDVVGSPADPRQLARELTDRYDDALLSLDRQLEPLLAALRPQDVVVFFSDHGEELWDHGGFEHGHTLYEELVKVALVVRAPGVVAGRIDQPASLVNLLPTVLELAGEPARPDLGPSLAPLLRAEAGPPPPPAALGWVLHGDDQWGAVHDGRKWLSGQGRAGGYDLLSDPGEERWLQAASADVQAELQAALGHPVVEAWRLHLPRGIRQATLTVPAGVERAWTGLEAPHWNVPQPTIVGSQVRLVVGEGQQPPGELYVLARSDDPTGVLAVVDAADATHELSPGDRSGEFSLDRAQVPLLDAGPAVVLDGEATEGLRALGYVE